MMNEITENLWIADIQDVQTKPTDRFDLVVSVCQDSAEDNVGCDYRHFNMADGEVDSYGGSSSFVLFRDAAQTVVEALESGETVLVHCHMGQSRSAAVCIAALGRYDGLSYNEAYNTVSDVRYIRPDPTLVGHAKTFIGER